MEGFKTFNEVFLANLICFLSFMWIDSYCCNSDSWCNFTLTWQGILLIESLCNLCHIHVPSNALPVLSPRGVFIICWLPFFLTHVLKAHCRSCCISPSLYSAVTWLGYLNSAVNPIIYTTFNIEFRKAFIKILHCWEPRRWRVSAVKTDLTWE